MVLKDSFVNEDRLREGETTKKIVESLPKGDKRRLNFLTVVVHGDVVINDCPDTTDAIHHWKRCPSGVPCVDLTEIVNQRVSAGPYEASQSRTGSRNLDFILPILPDFAPSRSYQNRQHYRIVFEEVGQPVSSLKNR